MPQADPFAGLSSAVQSTRNQAAGLSGMRSRFMADVSTIAPERRALGGRLSLDSARASAGGASPSFAGTLSNSLRVARARQGVANRGDAAIRQQQLRDRLEVARMGLRQRQRGIGALSDAANIREGVNLAQSQADRASRASLGSLVGGLAGAGLAAYNNREIPLEEIDMSTLPGRRGS